MGQDDERSIEQLNEEADIAADYLEGLLDITDYDGDIEMGIQNHRSIVQIVSDDDRDIKHLIGKNGEVVQALQKLTRLAVQQKTGERSNLIVDVDGYLKKHRETLNNSTLDAIDEVQETGQPVDLKPMNSFERKIAHEIVRRAGLKSRSHGEEPHRYVRVYLKAVFSGDTEQTSEDEIPIDDDLQFDRSDSGNENVMELDDSEYRAILSNHHHGEVYDFRRGLNDDDIVDDEPMSENDSFRDTDVEDEDDRLDAGQEDEHDMSQY